MDQGHILRVVVTIFAGIAAGVLTASGIALRLLDKKTKEVKKQRLEEETKRASRTAGGGMLPIHH